VTITNFRGAYFFLSNFFVRDLTLDNVVYRSGEHAFQAQKAFRLDERTYVMDALTPTEAKRRGRLVALRIGWEEEKLAIMERVVRAKFKDAQLAHLLKKTGDAQLIEGNTWDDDYWGVVVGRGENDAHGENHLGKILMKVRDELLAEDQRSA
jgi:ribA/ribD-fused uncharacterized protein